MRRSLERNDAEFAKLLGAHRSLPAEQLDEPVRRNRARPERAGCRRASARLAHPPRALVLGRDGGRIAVDPRRGIRVEPARRSQRGSSVCSGRTRALAELMPLLKASHESLQAMVALHTDAELDDPAAYAWTRGSALGEFAAGVRRQPLRLGPRHRSRRASGWTSELERPGALPATRHPVVRLCGCAARRAQHARADRRAHAGADATSRADFGIGSATAGLLTTAPVLMFALLTPLAALVIRRAGAELALMLSLSGVLLGTVIRARSRDSAGCLPGCS